MQQVNDRYTVIQRRDYDEMIRWNIYDNQRKVVVGSPGDLETKEEAIKVAKTMSKKEDPFELAKAYTDSESDKGLDSQDSYARLCGALEARIGLMLNTLRAHKPEAYEFLVNEYSWGK